jgi:hypothetical protein
MHHRRAPNVSLSKINLLARNEQRAKQHSGLIEPELNQVQGELVRDVFHIEDAVSQPWMHVRLRREGVPLQLRLRDELAGVVDPVTSRPAPPPS